jgi:hypothetical protein
MEGSRRCTRSCGCAIALPPCCHLNSCGSSQAFIIPNCLLHIKAFSVLLCLQAWVQNGHSPPTKPAQVESSPPITLPPSQPLPQEKLEYPRECFSSYYLGDADESKVWRPCA